MAAPNVSAQISVQVLDAVSLVPASAALETGASLPFTVLTGPGVSSSLSASAGSLQPTGFRGECGRRCRRQHSGGDGRGRSGIAHYLNRI